jgi:LuxR family maltose regulon positive regulatory protein
VSLTALKLTPPSTALPLMARERLLGKLTSDGEFKIILLRAPAGYGKTSLLRMIHANASHAPHRPAWLTLDSADNDPARLMLGLRAALLDAGAPASDNYDELSESSVTHLFLDDVERLDAAAIELLFSLITQVFPRRLCVYLGARNLHDFSTASLKAKGALRELDMQDLQFSADETVAYLRNARLDLPSNNLDLLQRAAEGWPAAIELIALAWKRLQGRSGITLPSLHSLKDLGDYLADEVFEAQPATIQAFLIATAPLQSFNAELADAARSARDSAALIAAIRAAGLPIQPLEGRWFRYHPLFAEHVAQQHPPAPALYLRAAEWLAEHDHALESIDYLIKGGRAERAADLLESMARALRSRGQISTVVQICDRLPRAVLEARPLLAATIIAGLVYTSRRQDLADWLHYCRQQQTLPYADRLYGEALRGLEPTLAFLEGDLDACHRLAHAYWPLQQESNVFDRLSLSYSIIYSCLWRGDLDEAERLLILAQRACGQANAVMGMAIGCFMHALLVAIKGDLDDAERQLAALDKIGSQYSQEIPPVLLHLFSAGLAMLMKYERNQLDTIAGPLQMANGLIMIGLPWEAHSGILLVQSRVIGAEHGAPAARQWLQEQVMGVTGSLPAPVRKVLETELSRLSTQLDTPAVMAGYAQLLGDGAGAEQHLLPCNEIDGGGIAQARLMIYTGRVADAVTRLRQLLTHAQAGQRRWRAAKLGLLLAIALERAGHQPQAEQALAPALEQAAQSGLVRCFLDEGPAALALLQAMQAKARHLLSAAAQTHLDHLLGLQAAPAAARAPLEELTQTECALLTMVAHGKTNKEIGDALFLSVNTVKWHMAQIFRKLDAGNRSQAVFNARLAGFLPKQ